MYTRGWVLLCNHVRVSSRGWLSSSHSCCGGGNGHSLSSYSASVSSFQVVDDGHDHCYYNSNCYDDCNYGNYFARWLKKQKKEQ